jgi:guanine deaminase
MNGRFLWPGSRQLLQDKTRLMTDLILRGRVLTFHFDPGPQDDPASYRYIEDGAVLVSEGKIAKLGDYYAVRRAAAPDVTLIDHRPNLILPGLIDTHIHFPQMQVIGSYGTQLLEWLNKYTFVEEQRFASAEHCARIASLFVDELIRHGTTTAVAYCTVHKESAEAYFAEAARRNMCLIGGKVLMDRNAPERLRDTPQSSYDESKALIGKWHGTGRTYYAISPRFGITSTDAQLEVAGALMREHPGCYLQTHLCENHAEIAQTKALFPWARDYTDVYERYGLLGPRSLFGHCIHLEPREIDALAQSQSVAVFCPTSNLFLGAGLYDREGLMKHGVRTAIATDVGGGTNYSMLRTLDEGYKALQLRGQRLSPLSSFFMVTLGNALALGLEDKIGTLEEGSDADIVILDARATPSMRLRCETVETLAQELFILQTMGDDRAVSEVYIAGKALKGYLA